MVEHVHKEHINKHKMAHMIGVAEYMRERASAYGFDGDEMYVLGLLHDIGYIKQRKGHEDFGASLVGGMGLNKKYITAIKNHGRNPYEAYETVSEATPEEVLLLEADMSVKKDGYRVGFKARLKDIGERYGKNGIEYKTACKTVDFVKEYTKTLSIELPYSERHVLVV